MRPVLLDTHVWAWSLSGDPKLSTKAIAALGSASTVFVSPISFYEVGQMVRLGKWPEMEPFLPRLCDLLREQGGHLAELNDRVCLLAATLDWAHRDPFDRFLLATARHLNLPLISADPVFDGWVERIW